jgi:Domain of unknown function (DUF5615)
VKFYANENFPMPVVERLRVLGHDVLTARMQAMQDKASPMKTSCDSPGPMAGPS